MKRLVTVYRSTIIVCSTATNLTPDEVGLVQAVPGQWLSQDEEVRARELCESRGGRPGFPSLINLRFRWT